MKRKYILLDFLFIFTLTAGAACGGGSANEQEAFNRSQPLTLKYWRVFENAADFATVIDDYSVRSPHVTIEYRKLRFEEFEKELVNALAEGRGPDVFSVHNTSVNEYKSKLLPLPGAVTLPVQKVEGSISKKISYELATVPSLTLRQLRDSYAQVVYEDVVFPDVIDEKGNTVDNIYGLPFSVDTLAMYYNRDILANSGIPLPATTWVEFQEQIQTMTKIDRENNILLAGAALGTSQNVSRSFDILSLIMMQNGTEMIDSGGAAAFNNTPSSLQNRDRAPGLQALTFYTDFAQPTKVVYTWNGAQKSALDEFIAGNVGYFFGYSYHLPAIRARAPKLNFAIAKIPQIENNPEINYANYWVEVVSKNTRYPNEAWDFVQFLASEKEAKTIIDSAKKPTAHLSLINSQVEDIDLSVFASQVLKAKSWYRGKDANAAEGIFKNMIDEVLLGIRETDEVLNNAVGQINQTLR